IMGQLTDLFFALFQRSPALLLESCCPADFSSNSSQTHLNQLIKVFRVDNYR
ncbi:hypothetical protein M9458_022199, partial [Cirrhinus mrigala]